MLGFLDPRHHQAGPYGRAVVEERLDRLARLGEVAGVEGGLGEGEVQTLYVLDDWREHGLGRRLLAAGAAHLKAAGCRSAFLWVLRDNPSRWFYQRLGGRPAAESDTRVAGVAIPQVAFVWDPIDPLLAGAPQG